MRIALLTDGIQPYVIGGMQKHSFYVVKYLAKNGIYVDLYHTSQNKDYDINKLEVFTEEEKKYIRSYVVDFPSFGKMPGHYLRESYEYSIRVFDFLKNNLDVDFIYVKGFAGWKLLEEKKKGWKTAPVGIKFHGLNMFQKLPSFKGWMEALLLRGPVKFNLKYADHVFSYGGKITDITKAIGVPENKIIEIPTGIDPVWLSEPEQSKEAESKRKFIFIGRYERVKGVIELNAALKNILRSAEFEFHFIGPIPDRLRLKSEQVIYHGTISDPEKIKKIIDSCDVLICPSYSEGMPNVIIEAMSRGLAVIATDVGAINCLVSEKNGWLLKECSIKTIEHSILEAIKIKHDELYLMKKKSYFHVTETLLWDKIAFKLISEIEKRIVK